MKDINSTNYRSFSWKGGSSDCFLIRCLRQGGTAVRRRQGLARQLAKTIRKKQEIPTAAANSQEWSLFVGARFAA
jgi:hypothetical protein